MSATVEWTALGAAVGAAHAVGLWRSAHRLRQSMFAAVWRIPVVAGVLAASVVAGGVLPAAGGWACGLAGVSVLLTVRGGR